MNDFLDRNIEEHAVGSVIGGVVALPDFRSISLTRLQGQVWHLYKGYISLEAVRLATRYLALQQNINLKGRLEQPDQCRLTLVSGEKVRATFAGGVPFGFVICALACSYNDILPVSYLREKVETLWDQDDSVLQLYHAVRCLVELEYLDIHNYGGEDIDQWCLSLPREMALLAKLCRE